MAISPASIMKSNAARFSSACALRLAFGSGTTWFWMFPDQDLRWRLAVLSGHADKYLVIQPMASCQRAIGLKDDVARVGIIQHGLAVAEGLHSI